MLTGDHPYFYNFIILLLVVSTFSLSEMDPKAKASAWAHGDVVDGVIYCKYCKKLIKGGGIFQAQTTLGCHQRPSEGM